MKDFDSNRLLVIDHSPEGAEEINSLLRNSGIIVRAIFAKTNGEAEKQIKSEAPFLIIYNAGAAKSVAVTKILQLADNYQITAGVRFSPSDPDILLEALNFYSCFAINEDENDHLIKLVSNLLLRSSSKLEFDGLQTRLDELQSRNELLLESSRESIAYIHEGFHAYANRAYLQLLQVESFQNIESVSLLEIMSSEDVDLKKLLRNLNNGEFPENATKVLITNPAANSFEVDLIFSAARYDGEDCIQMMVRQVDSNAALKNELVRLRQTDPVTNLANRKTFNEIVGKKIGDRANEDKTTAVVYLMADGAQDLRSSLGVSGWDAVMVEFSLVIKASIEEIDTAARFDDNGFALLLIRGSNSSLQSVVESTLSKLQKDVTEIDGIDLSVTFSAGIAMLGSLESSANEAIDHARIAHAQAAEEGNCARYYKPKLAAIEPDEQDQQWIERILYALDNHELYSVQQSIVSLEGDAEGLFESKTYLREEGIDLDAAEFIPIAERNDLGSRIDRHVLKGLMTAIAGTGDRHIINLSANSLEDFSFSSWLMHKLEELNVEGSQLILQLLSSSVEANLKHSKRLIEELKPSGCSFSLSSFSDRKKTMELLNHLDIALVKLRPDLIVDLANSSTHQAIVRTVVGAAGAKQIGVIAGDIQDAADLAVLWQCGVKLVSGDFLNE
jgi:diguanylate cyclase (GGDEF)-like protein